MARGSENANQTTQYSGPVLFYNEVIIDHFTNPRNVGELTPQHTDGYAQVGDPSCGDRMKLWCRRDPRRRVAQAISPVIDNYADAKVARIAE